MIRRKQIGLRLSEGDLRKLEEISEWAKDDPYGSLKYEDRTGIIVHAISKLHSEMRVRENELSERDKKQQPTHIKLRKEAHATPNKGAKRRKGRKQ
jgi:hypothetical protein